MKSFSDHVMRVPLQGCPKSECRLTCVRMRWVHWTKCALCPLLTVSCGDAGLGLFTLSRLREWTIVYITSGTHTQVGNSGLFINDFSSASLPAENMTSRIRRVMAFTRCNVRRTVCSNEGQTQLLLATVQQCIGLFRAPRFIPETSK
jgi:hypothetical protein